MIVAVIQTGQAFRPTIQYFLTATVLIAIALAICLRPLSDPTQHIPAGTSSPVGGSYNQLTLAFLSVLDSLPIRLSAFVFGTATVMHVLVSVLAIQGLGRWMLAICLPVVGVSAWHVVAPERANFNLSNVVVFMTPLFAIGFAIVNSMFYDSFRQNKQIDMD